MSPRRPDVPGLTPAQSAIAYAMKERDLEQAVADACKSLRLLRYHTHRAQHSPAGFPDDFIVGPGGILVRELKRQTENPSSAQEEWLLGLADHGLNVGVWRPSDLLCGLIVEQLTAISGRR